MDYKWKALAIVSLGSLMGSIDSTVLIIGFPSVARDLNASLVDMVWVLLIYLVMGTALVLSLGRLADMKGRRRLYLAGFVVFTVGSGLCGFAGNGLELIGFRALQGVGGAMLVANSFAIVSDAFPAWQRGGRSACSRSSGGRVPSRDLRRRHHPHAHLLALDLLDQPPDRGRRHAGRAPGCCGSRSRRTRRTRSTSPPRSSSRRAS